MRHIALGIHCSLQPEGHFASDGNVAVTIDGRLAFAITEDRLSRKRYDGNFRSALHKALQQTGIKLDQVSEVGVSTFARPVTCGESDLDDIRRDVADATARTPSSVVVMRSHHEAHAFAAAAFCPVERMLVAVIDNEGSIIGDRRLLPYWRNAFERTSYYLFHERGFKLIARDHDQPGEVGYGKIYSKVTRYCGFRSYQESGKTMGLAAFGDQAFSSTHPCFFSEPAADQAGVSITPGERCAMHNSSDGMRDLIEWFRERGVKLPPPRTNDEPVRWIDATLAAWVQFQLEVSLSRRLRALLVEHEVDVVALSGGVALNSVMNARLRSELPLRDLFVPPSPGDAGLAVGVVAWLEWRRTGLIPKFDTSPYIGSRYGAMEIASAVADKSYDLTVQIVSDPPTVAAAALAEGQIIGWFQGAGEFGPRALGHRSILADPRNPWMKEILNNQVKLREWFRPYAPAVLDSTTVGVFEECCESPYMMHVGTVRAGMCTAMPSALHVDGTARLQTVRHDFSPEFARLIEEFTRLTGTPAVLNTSFNLAGEPIVETPQDALETFMRCPRMDALFISDTVIRRKTS